MDFGAAVSGTEAPARWRRRLDLLVASRGRCHRARTGCNVAGVPDLGKLADWFYGLATAFFAICRACDPSPASPSSPHVSTGLNGLSLGVAEAPMLTKPLPKLDSALDPDGTRCNDHAEWLAGLGCAPLASDQLDLYRDRGFEVANASRFWRPLVK